MCKCAAEEEILLNRFSLLVSSGVTVENEIASSFWKAAGKLERERILAVCYVLSPHLSFHV